MSHKKNEGNKMERQDVSKKQDTKQVNEKYVEQASGYNMNSPEYKELTQRQRAVLEDDELTLEEKQKKISQVQEEVANEGGVTHEGQIEPDRLNFNQYDNTAEQYDKAKGSPADPKLRENIHGSEKDREGTIVDAGTEEKTNDNYGTGAYATGKDNQEEAKKMRASNKKNNKKNDK